MKKNNKKGKNKSKKNENLLFSFVDFNLDSKFTVFEVVIFILISIIFGMIAGCLLTYHTSSLSSIRTDSNLKEIINVYKNIKESYYEDVDDDQLTNAAVKGMINSLDDPYSVFLDDSSTDTFTESIDGKYVGIGIDVSYNGEYYEIVSVQSGSSADSVGIKSGDIILKIDNIDCHYITSSDLAQLIRGKVGTSLEIQIKRKDEVLTFKTKRIYIDILNVTDKIILANDKNIGYISLDVFSSNSYDQFINSLKKLEDKKIDSLIIDVRGNPGGHLLQAKKILELFLPKKTVLYQIDKNNTKTNVYSSTKEYRKYPIGILIDSSTASAAEVLALSLKENYKNALIIGSTSYGKGTVQKSQTLSTGTSIKFTIERWLSPKGTDINGVGINPDVIVEDAADDDFVLQMAIDKLK